MIAVVVLLGAVVIAAGAVIGFDYRPGAPRQQGRAAGLNLGDQRAATATAPLNGRTEASFDLLAATARVRVTLGDLGDRLFLITAPPGAGIRPEATLRADAVLLTAADSGAGRDDLDVVLSAKVRWALRFSGYADERRADLTGGTVTGLTVAGAAHSTTLTLPAATAGVPLHATGAIDELTVHTPAGSPVRVTVGAGVRKAVAGTRTLTGLAPGSTLTPKGPLPAGHYELDAAAPIAVLTLRTTP